MEFQRLIAALNLDAFVAAFVDPANLAGHISYVLLITSMLMRTMHWLRLFAISAGTFSAIYYFTLGNSISFFWESMFTLVNAVQLVILFVENRRGRFSAEESYFIDHVLKDVERAHVRRLMKLGAWTEIGEDFCLIKEDEEPSQLVYVVKGSARVERNGRPVGVAGPGDFLGEMSYLSGRPASATVISQTPMRFLAFDREQLRRHLSKNVEIRHAMEAEFNRNLVELVKTSRSLHAANSGSGTAAGAGGLEALKEEEALLSEELARLAGETEHETSQETANEAANETADKA